MKQTKNRPQPVFCLRLGFTLLICFAVLKPAFVLAGETGGDTMTLLLTLGLEAASQSEEVHKTILSSAGGIISKKIAENAAGIVVVASAAQKIHRLYGQVGDLGECYQAEARAYDELMLISRNFVTNPSCSAGLKASWDTIALLRKDFRTKFDRAAGGNFAHHWGATFLAAIPFADRSDSSNSKQAAVAMDACKKTLSDYANYSKIMSGALNSCLQTDFKIDPSQRSNLGCRCSTDEGLKYRPITTSFPMSECRSRLLRSATPRESERWEQCELRSTLNDPAVGQMKLQARAEIKAKQRRQEAIERSANGYCFLPITCFPDGGKYQPHPSQVTMRSEERDDDGNVTRVVETIKHITGSSPPYSLPPQIYTLLKVESKEGVCSWDLVGKDLDSPGSEIAGTDSRAAVESQGYHCHSPIRVAGYPIFCADGKSEDPGTRQCGSPMKRARKKQLGLAHARPLGEQAGTH